MIKKILLPLDGSKLAEQAIPNALELAQKFDATIVLVWVLHPHLAMSAYGASLYYDLMTMERREAKAYLGTMRLKLQQSYPHVETKVLNGLAAQAIIDLAEEISADVIVMSTHGRSGLDRWVHGSVATKVLQYAPCPVLLVKAYSPEEETKQNTQYETTDAAI